MCRGIEVVWGCWLYKHSVEALIYISIKIVFQILMRAYERIVFSDILILSGLGTTWHYLLLLALLIINNQGWWHRMDLHMDHRMA